MWLYQGEEFTEEMISYEVGFVYIITNLSTNKKYIGKKLFTAAKTKTVAGKKKRYRVASNWLKYYGSNTELISDVKELGAENFKREILHLCLSKGVCNYLEAREQMDRRVLESEDFYNGWIILKCGKPHLGKLNVEN